MNNKTTVAGKRRAKMNKAEIFERLVNVGRKIELQSNILYENLKNEEIDKKALKATHRKIRKYIEDLALLYRELWYILMENENKRI